MGDNTPADSGGDGAEQAYGARGLARRPRLSRRPVHGWGSADDHCAPRSAPYRYRNRATGAKGVSGALRGASRLPEGAGGSSQTIRGKRRLTQSCPSSSLLVGDFVIAAAQEFDETNSVTKGVGHANYATPIVRLDLASTPLR